MRSSVYAREVDKRRTVTASIPYHHMNLNDSGPLHCQNSVRGSSLSIPLYSQNTHHAVSSALTSLFLGSEKYFERCCLLIQCHSQPPI
jgi:hypothetical protein